VRNERKKAVDEVKKKKKVMSPPSLFPHTYIYMYIMNWWTVDSVSLLVRIFQRT
jgi:hypothetical protein